MKIKSILLLFMVLFLTSCAKRIATAISEDDEWIVVDTTTRWGMGNNYGINTNDPQDIVPNMTYLGDYPSWSADNQWIVYSTSDTVPPESPDIYLVKSDGTNKVKVTKGYHPVWSPKDNQIIYHSHGQVYLIDVDCFVRSHNKSCSLQSFSVTTGQDPDWAPDGERVTFERDESIYVVNIDGSGEYKVSSHTDGGCREPDWSPTNDKIVFWCWGKPNEGFYTVNGDGTDMTKIETEDLGGISPKWSPSGDKIAFIHYLSISSVGGTRSAVYIMNVDGSNRTKLTFAEDESVFGFSWMPPHTKPKNCTAFCK